MTDDTAPNAAAAPQADAQTASQAATAPGTAAPAPESGTAAPPVEPPANEPHSAPGADLTVKEVLTIAQVSDLVEAAKAHANEKIADLGNQMDAKIEAAVKAHVSDAVSAGLLETLVERLTPVIEAKVETMFAGLVEQMEGVDVTSLEAKLTAEIDALKTKLRHWL